MSHIARSNAAPNPAVIGSIAPARPGQAITSWLDRLQGLLGLPDAAAREIVEELDTHLRERVDDLVRSGSPEAQAVHLAISELGDIADLALGYRQAQKSTPWRPIMKALLFVGVGSAITLAASALVPQSPAPGAPPSGVRVYAPSEGGWNVPAAADKPVQNMQVQEEPLENVLSLLAASQGATLLVQRSVLEQSGISLEDVVSLNVKSLPLARVLSLVNDSLGRSGSEMIDVRFADGLMEVASRSFFDRRESVLAVYDIAELMNIVDVEEIMMLLNTVVEPESWVDNGGELAQGQVVSGSGKLFITAPPRIHSRISWVLEQLNDVPDQEASRTVRVIPLAHIDAGSASETARDLLGVPPAQIVYDASTNSLMARGTVDQLNRLERLVGLLDNPPAVADPASEQTPPRATDAGR